MKPKAFVSYSWTSLGHREQVRRWAEQLVGDGVEIVLDTWDLREGDDKFAFMERMVADESVTHVLVFCDSAYARKADERRAGVGTESQIISAEIYSKARQSKFIPIVCEFDERGEPFLPVFMKTRIWLNFASPQGAAENWEQLVRLLYDKPAFERPRLGEPPAYVLADSSTPVSHAGPKLLALQQALLQGRPGVRMYRDSFHEACLAHADTLRTRSRPDVVSLGTKIIDDCAKLKTVRDHIADWVLLESSIAPTPEFVDSLIGLLERMLELKSRPAELSSWQEAWFDAHRVFVHETFLYVVAALVRNGAFGAIRAVLTASYMRPEKIGRDAGPFESFYAFFGYSEALHAGLSADGRRFYSSVGELMKRQADHHQIGFADVMQADLLVLLMAFVLPDHRWYPQTLHYATHGTRFDLFLRATLRKHFLNLSLVTGIGTATELREAVMRGHERLGVAKWDGYFHMDNTFWNMLNLDALDTRS